MFSKLLNGYRMVFSFALVAPESPAVASNGAASPVASPVVATRRELLATALAKSSRFTWRKIATLAAKHGSTATDIKAELIGMGFKISRNGLLVKVGSIGTVAEPVATAPASNGWDSIGGNDFADDAEDDDYNEDEDEDEDSEDSEDEDESDFSDLDEESDSEDSEFNAVEVTILTDMLNSPNYRWRKLPTLAQAAGLSESETKEYLEHIGAVESRRGGLFRAA